jgi:hypothetical protein
MKTLFKCLVVYLAAIAFLMASDDLLDSAGGEAVVIKRIDGGITTELGREMLGGAVIPRISFTFSPNSSPRSCIVAGKVVSDNTGTGLERVLIRIGEESKAPVVAAMTNVDGEFKFRLWIDEDDYRHELETKEPFAAFLYVGGHVTDLDQTSPLATFGAFVRRYKLAELQAHADKDKK